MKKLFALFFVVVLCLCSFSALADIEVGKHSHFVLDYGEESKFKESYYIAYVTNNGTDNVYLGDVCLSLFDKNGDLIIQDINPYDYASPYLESGETSCIVFKTYYGESNYEKSPSSAKLELIPQGNDIKEYADINLSKSEIKTNEWFDSSQYSMYVSIKNISKKDYRNIKVALVLEDKDGNPIYLRPFNLFNVIMRKDDSITTYDKIDDSNYLDKALKNYFTTNNIVPVKVVSFVYYSEADTAPGDE